MLKSQYIFYSIDFVFHSFKSFSFKLFCSTIERRPVVNFTNILRAEQLFGIGGPRYIRYFYLQIRVCAIENWQFLKNLSPNL